MKLCGEVGEEEYKSNSLTEALAAPGFNGGIKYMSVACLSCSTVIGVN